MQVIKEDGEVPIKLWVGGGYTGSCQTRWKPDIEDSALQQLHAVAKLGFIDPHGLAVMPDAHWGMGTTVGSVIATNKAIIPAAVGVDIGCGMVAVRTSLKAEDLPDSLADLRAAIERGVPVGFSSHSQQKTPEAARSFMGSSNIPTCVDALIKDQDKTAAQLGTLGGGNHFIEICLDESKDVWIMLHSGSRGIGNVIGKTFIDKAKAMCARWHIDLPHGDLAYLPEGDPVFDDYVSAVAWAQDYAAENRRIMLAEVIRNLEHCVKPFTLTNHAINCHHNYIERENHHGRNVWLTRKGAIRARLGDLGIIPGSMGQRSFIVSGLGNPDSYCSCSHGAGRRMGRAEARRQFTVADLVAQTQGVECRKDDAVLDEIPSGYKDIDIVMDNQKDLVTVQHTLKQVLCVKGG